jgi:glutamate/tyrosine decarboxylase-like PLP-dependent enzyme
MVMVESLYKLPVEGSSYEAVMDQVIALRGEMTNGQLGKLASTSFQGQNEMQKLVHDAFVEFMDWNGLFSFRESAAAKMENDVLDICIDLLNGGEAARANLTVGGTESNFSGLHAMRGWARATKPHIKQPEIVAPYSTHSTVHKTAKYLDIKVVTVPQKDDLSVDIEGIREAVGPNTIGIVGSAPNWPYGTVDPIEEFGQIAIKADLWLHVDACVGGYILPFFRELGVELPFYDFTVPGVRSISADLHKYGYAPKPCSTILWRSQGEQQYHFMPINEWACGTYLSQGFVGSRTMGPIAGIWALMHFWGREGYLENAKSILRLKSIIVRKVESIEGLVAWKTDGPLQMIGADDFDITLVVGGLEKKGWSLLGVNVPPAIHLTLDVMEEEFIEKFTADLEEVVEGIRTGEITEEGLLTYGGVGDKALAPKWLLSALEIFEQGIDS